MSVYRWIKLVVILLLMASFFSVSVTSPDLATASNPTVITVPGGDIEALYDAVYDQNRQPRDSVEINLEAGVFALDPSKPFDGRLVLGDNTTLRSSLEMAVDANGIPLVDENNEPTVLVEGAKIDGSAIEPATFGEGIIMVGDNGLVEQLWLDGGGRPGIEITFRGTVRKVRSTNHSIGVRARAVGSEVEGVIEESVITDNASIGIAIIAIAAFLPHPTYSDAELQVNLHRNAAINGNANLVINSGISTENGEIKIEASHNVFRGGSFANIRFTGAQDFLSTGGNNNEAELILTDSLIADGGDGIRVEGGTLHSFSDPSIPLEERHSSNNEAKVKLSDNTFEDNILDIRVEGSLSFTDEPGGDNNEAKVEIEGGDPAALTIEVHDCFPEEAFPTCTSEAAVTFDDDDDDD